ncbi:hypothetical protein HAX54_037787 [Datura stramonium]|uniref:Acetyltransferase n=1 Tax=Datura stramonium TaxID=4076 RepID=A0ABS8SHE9_DATST|nr:hypothetical protein [Datura stramonium]
MGLDFTQSRHRTLMNIFDKAPVVDKDVFVAPGGFLNLYNFSLELLVLDEEPNFCRSFLPLVTLTVSVSDLVQIYRTTPLFILAKSNIKLKVLPTIIGNNVTVGHSAVVHGCTIEDEAFIGMGATLLDGVHVEKHAMIAAGARRKQNWGFPLERYGQAIQRSF